jgi:hypothetical protein
MRERRAAATSVRECATDRWFFFRKNENLNLQAIWQLRSARSPSRFPSGLTFFHVLLDPRDQFL